jgi:type II secretory pathway pseudopilin PulG
MIVVLILGILAALGAAGYRRYIGKARATEAVAMIAEMASKEQVYFLEFAQFLPLTNVLTDPPLAAAVTVASATELATQFWPSNPATSTFDSVRVGTIVPISTSRPKSWQYLAINPKDSVLYCTYFASAGLSGSSPVAGTIGAGSGFLGSAAISIPWFYVLGSCNLKSTSCFPNCVTTFVMTSNSPTLKTVHEDEVP